MKCPKCGEELRRSTKESEYGLCDVCRKKYKWIDHSDKARALFETKNKLKTFNSDGSVTIKIKTAGKYEITVDDFSIRFTAKGVLNLFNKGMVGEKVIPFNSITAVQFKKSGALTSGYIQFVLFGTESKGGLSKAINDENSLVFATKDEEKCMYELKYYLEDKMHQLRAPSATSSGLSDLKQLKELYDTGIITEHEFTAKKKQILGLK